MPRLTRRESQELTRSRMIEEATKLFLGRGFRATSLDDIANAAGFSQGAVYSNFANKTELGIAVVHALYEHEEDRASALLESAAGNGLDAWFDALAEWASSGIGDAGWTRFEMELAATGGGTREGTATRYAQFRARWADLIESSARDAGLDLPLPAETLMIGVLGLGLGIGAQRAADPAIDGATFAVIVRAYVSALVTAGRDSG